MRVATNSSLEEALAYDALGLVVIPQRPRDKRPLVPWNDYKQGNSRSGERVIRTLWEHQFPDAGVMAVLGPPSRMVAVDIDGEQAHRAFLERMGELPHTATVKTGNPDPYRKHLLFRLPPDLTTTARITPWDPGLEFRGKGGLIILPPSIHPSGNQYRWLDGLSIWEAGLADLPEQICREFRQRSEARSVSNDALRPPMSEGRASTDGIKLTTRERIYIARIPLITTATQQFLLGIFASGPQWNQRLFNAACDLNGCGWLQSRATHLLLKGAQPWNDQELSNALATIHSAYSEQRVPATKRHGR